MGNGCVASFLNFFWNFKYFWWCFSEHSLLSLQKFTQTQNVLTIKMICVYNFLKIYLKVTSGQIGSVWEWYHWMDLEKDINRYGLIFKFNFWVFEKTSYKKWIQPPACSKILSSYWLAHFYLLKNPPKAGSFLVWIAGCWNVLLTSSNPKNNCFFRHFWSTVPRKRLRFVPIQWSEQARGWINFWVKWLKTLKFSKIHN